MRSHRGCGRRRARAGATRRALHRAAAPFSARLRAPAAVSTATSPLAMPSTMRATGSAVWLENAGGRSREGDAKARGRLRSRWGDEVAHSHPASAVRAGASFGASSALSTVETAPEPARRRRAAIGSVSAQVGEAIDRGQVGGNAPSRPIDAGRRGARRGRRGPAAAEKPASAASAGWPVRARAAARQRPAPPSPAPTSRARAPASAAGPRRRGTAGANAATRGAARRGCQGPPAGRARGCPRSPPRRAPLSR